MFEPASRARRRVRGWRARRRRSRPGRPRAPASAVSSSACASFSTSSPLAAENRMSAPALVVSSDGDPYATRRPWSTMPTRSQSCSASCIAWVVSTTVAPRSRSSRMSVPRRGARTRVHARGRLVEEHQARPADQRERERQALLLPARHPAHERVLRLAEADEVEEPVGIVGVVVVGREELERLERPDPRIEATVLEHHADLGAQLRRRRATGRRRARARRRRRRGGSPRGSRRWWSCPRRSARGGRTPRRCRSRTRARRRPGSRRSASRAR